MKTLKKACPHLKIILYFTDNTNLSLCIMTCHEPCPCFIRSWHINWPADKGN